MKTVEDHLRSQLPDSGFGLWGKALFVGRPIEDILREKTSASVLEASSYALAVEPFSQLQVRRRLIQAARFQAPLVLHDAVTVTVDHRFPIIVFRAIISFTGDPDLFQVKGGGLLQRELNATIDNDRLIITVQTYECDQPMVPYALTSELIAIRHMLSDQQRTIAEFNRQEAARWHAFVKERWAALCQMRPLARRRVNERAAQERRELLRMYDVVFGGDGALDAEFVALPTNAVE